MSALYRVVCHEWRKLTIRPSRFLALVGGIVFGLTILFFGLSSIQYNRSVTDYDAAVVEYTTLRDRYKLYLDFLSGENVEVPDYALPLPDQAGDRRFYLNEYLKYDLFLRTTTFAEDYLDLRFSDFSGHRGMESPAFVLRLSEMATYFMMVVTILLSIGVGLKDFETGSIKNLIGAGASRQKIFLGKLLFVFSIQLLLIGLIIGGGILLGGKETFLENVMIFTTTRLILVSSVQVLVLRMTILLLAMISLSALCIFVGSILEFNTKKTFILILFGYLVEWGVLELTRSLTRVVVRSSDWYSIERFFFLQNMDKMQYVPQDYRFWILAGSYVILAALFVLLTTQKIRVTDI
jgi:hypothetical protein